MMRSFQLNTRGSVLPFVAIGIGVILSVSALAVDISRYMAAKSKFEHAVDQALLAAASVSSRISSTAMSAEAQKFFTANFPTSYNGVVKLDNMNVTFDAATFQWTGTASGTIKPTFGSLVGLKEMKISHTAKVVWDQTSVEVVFVVDLSPHMCAKTSVQNGSIVNEPDPNCDKLTAVKSALNYLIGGDKSGKTSWAGLPILTSTDGRPGYRIGIVPFTHKVKLPDTSNIPDVIAAAENQSGDQNYFSSFSTDPGATETSQYPLPPVTPLVALTSTSNRDSLLGAVKNLNTYYNVPGWTRSSLGMLTGALMLDPDYSSYFSKGYSFNGVVAKAATTSDFTDSRDQKIIFLLTDGANMGCCFSSQPNPDPKTGKPNYNNQYLYTYRLDNQFLTGEKNTAKDGLCGQIKDQGIQVYTIAYDVQGNDANNTGVTIQKVLQNCASGPENINYFNIPAADTDSLTKAYGTIAQSLTRLRLSY